MSTTRLITNPDHMISGSRFSAILRFPGRNWLTQLRLSFSLEGLYVESQSPDLKGRLFPFWN